MPIHKKIVQGALVLGWLVWSLPAMAAGEHSEGQEHISGNHGDAGAAKGEHGGGNHGAHVSGNKHGGAGGKHGGHGYGRPTGPPADIPAHIKERLDPDGTKVNLNRSLIGVKGMQVLADMPELKKCEVSGVAGKHVGG